MDSRINASLYDIINAIEEIESFLKGIQRNFMNIKTTLKQKELLKGILK